MEQNLDGLQNKKVFVNEKIPSALFSVRALSFFLFKMFLNF